MMFPDVIRDIILDYAAIWELLPWIDINEISWSNMAKNMHPHAAALFIHSFEHDSHGADAGPECMEAASRNPYMWPWLCKNPEFINKRGIIHNPSAWDYVLAEIIPTLKCRPHGTLSSLPHTISWLEKNQDKINWSTIASNPGAEKLVMANLDKIHYQWLYVNPAPWAIALLETTILGNMKTGTWDRKYVTNLCPTLSLNSGAFDLLLKLAPMLHEDGISEVVDYKALSSNTDPRAVELVMSNPHLIDWRQFSKNPSAIKYLSKWKHKLNWATLCENPAIFVAKRPIGVRELL